MTHYVCPACQQVSDTPGVCQTDGCVRHGQSLMECNCMDGRHEQVMNEEGQKGTMAGS